MKYIVLTLLLIGITSLSAERAYVKRVVDGDTFVRRSGERVRMTGINAPEMDAPFGEDSKKYLKSLIEGKSVELIKDQHSSNTDKYKRQLRYVFLDGKDINLQMIEDGYAWAFTRYKFKESNAYKAAERTASAKNIGLWPTYKNGTPQADAEPKTKEKDWLKAITILALAILAYFIKKFRR